MSLLAPVQTGRKMHDENGPSFVEFLLIISGFLAIAAVGVCLILFAFLFPLPIVMVAGAGAGCGTVYSGVRFISRLLDPRDAKRPAGPP
jgi:hypothetical protein